MLGTQNLSMFLVSCILLNHTPGQDTMFILGRSIAQGRKAGLISAMGIMSGVLIHTSLTALGLSAILATSAVAFSIVKFAGAGYLIWIGIDFLRSREYNDKVENVEKEQLGTLTIYRQGVLTNVLNPKVSLFFLSFLPQFVDPRAGFIFTPFIVLGLIFFTTGSIWFTVLVFG